MERFDSPDAFIKWARRHAVPVCIPDEDDDFNDLAAIKETVGDARIVALGESAHYIKEWLRFRCRLFKYLVTELGFTAFVFETGLIEAKMIYDYVLGPGNDWDEVNTKGYASNLGLWQEQQEVVAWMRAYNADPGNKKKLKFYGMDGTGIWRHVHDGLTVVLAYLQRVDEEFADTVKNELLPQSQKATLLNQSNLKESEWDRFLSGVARLQGQIDRQRIDYIGRSSKEEYEWICQFARIIQQTSTIFADCAAHPEDSDSIFWNSRDAAMAEQLEWIVKREGPDAKFVVGAHNGHLQQHPLNDRLDTMGRYLSTRIPREQMVFIGAQNAWSHKPGDGPKPNSNQSILSKVGPSHYLLDLRNAPATGPVRDWLDEMHDDRSNLSYRKAALGKAWDAILYADEVSLATKAIPKSWQPLIVEPDPSLYDAYTGTYEVQAFIGYAILNITVSENRLYADGMDDANGECFPPARTELFPISRTTFVWKNWPAQIRFNLNKGEKADSITLELLAERLVDGNRLR